MKATASSKIYLAVIGPSTATDAILDLAEAVGGEVAKAGAILLTGGMGGAMEAASRGAKTAGGLTVGILPGSVRHVANAYLDISLPTGLGEMRNALLVRSADGVIAVGGGVGTLSELALAAKLGRPIAGIQTWRAASNSEGLLIHEYTSAAEAVAAIVAAIKRGGSPVKRDHR